ncbi:TPA_asm: M [Zanthoxylum betacytorhabdovirus 3]|nr:TPA_asm: M [Zanthoxilum betacytorhabdovirus 3]
MESNKGGSAVRINDKQNTNKQDDKSSRQDSSPQKIRRVGIESSPAQNFSHSNKFRLISNEELKINYCGVISSFRGELVGRNKEDLITNYKDIITDCMLTHLNGSGGISSDITCDVSILSAVLSLNMENKKMSDCIKQIPNDFLLGENVYKMTIEAIPMQIVRVAYPIRFNSNRDFSFKYNIADDNKFKFTFTGSGSMILWKVSEDMVLGTYKVNQSIILPGTVRNSPPDNTAYFQNKPKGESSSSVEGPSIKYLSEEQKIASDLLKSVKNKI